MTDIELLRSAKEHLIKNDVQWIALDCFRVWYMRPYTDSDGVMGVELGSDEFQITPCSHK